jgi:hypothetical protein
LELIRHRLEEKARNRKQNCYAVWPRWQEQKIVPIHSSLERPHVPVWFLERRLYALASEAGIVDEEFTIRALLCRSRRMCLMATLEPHSLIGADMHWRRARDRRLAEWLHAQQHQAIVVPAGASVPIRNSIAVGWRKICDRCNLNKVTKATIEPTAIPTCESANLHVQLESLALR